MTNRRRKQSLVPYFQWRDGRPRWEPGPHLRARGYKGQDLKDDRGAWHGMGAAMEHARAINAAIETGKPPVVEARRSGRNTMGELFDALEATGKWKGGTVRGRKLADSTLQGYRAHVKALRAWCGDIPAAALTPAEVETFYDQLCEGRGAATGNAMMRVLRLTYNHGVKKLRWILPPNPVPAEGELIALDGRLVMWEQGEIEAFVLAAEWTGLYPQADAAVLAVLTAQRQKDLREMPVLVKERGVYRIRQSKTKRFAYLPPVLPLEARLDVMRERRALQWPNVTFANQLLDVDGTPYDNRSRFGDQFRLVRAVASGNAAQMAAHHAYWKTHYKREVRVPSNIDPYPHPVTPDILGKRFADFRDTAVTWLFEALKDTMRVINISGHSIKTADRIIDKHYFVRNADSALASAVDYDRFLARTKMGA